MLAFLVRSVATTDGKRLVSRKEEKYPSKKCTNRGRVFASFSPPRVPHVYWCFWIFLVATTGDKRLFSRHGEKYTDEKTYKSWTGIFTGFFFLFSRGSGEMKTKKSEKWASTKITFFTLVFGTLDSEGGIGGIKLTVETSFFVVYVGVYFHP